MNTAQRVRIPVFVGDNQEWDDGTDLDEIIILLPLIPLPQPLPILPLKLLRVHILRPVLPCRLEHMHLREIALGGLFGQSEGLLEVVEGV